MDRRCPRNLRYHPDSWCPLAVVRLKRLRSEDRELTEEEENKLPGCAWAVSHQMSNYCFFKYAAEYLDHALSDVEVAHLNNLSQATVKKTERVALEKIRKDKSMIELKTLYEGQQIIEGRNTDVTHKIK
jgi:hypothetical protein